MVTEKLVRDIWFVPGTTYAELRRARRNGARILVYYGGRPYYAKVSDLPEKNGSSRDEIVVSGAVDLSGGSELVRFTATFPMGS